MAKSKKTPVIDYALKYIYRYPKTEKELRIKLLEKHYTEEEIEKAVQYLKSQWWLDDKRFTEMYIESELIKKWKPLIVVKNTLLSKWVDSNIVNQLIDEKFKEIAEWIINKLIQEIVKMKQKWKEWFDIIQTLMRRGYSLKFIKKAIERLENSE